MTKNEIQELVDLLFDRFERMTDTELMMLRAAWDDTNAEDRELAWQHVKYEVEVSSRQAMLDDSRHRVSSWINNSPLVGIVGMATLPSNPSGMDQATVRQAAMPPMLDALAATIVSDTLDPHDAAILFDPLVTVAAEKDEP